MNWFDALAQFCSLLFKVGITEWPVISDAIARATRGEDPLAGLAAERIEKDIIVGGHLKLELEMAAQHLRIAHEQYLVGVKL